MEWINDVSCVATYLASVGNPIGRGNYYGDRVCCAMAG